MNHLSNAPFTAGDTGVGVIDFKYPHHSADIYLL